MDKESLSPHVTSQMWPTRHGADDGSVTVAKYRRCQVDQEHNGGIVPEDKGVHPINGIHQQEAKSNNRLGEPKRTLSFY